MATMTRPFGEPRQLTLLEHEDIGSRAEPCSHEDCEGLHAALVLIYREDPTAGEIEMLRLMFPRVETRAQRLRRERAEAEAVAAAMIAAVMG